jgi:hypothetical protein
MSGKALSIVSPVPRVPTEDDVEVKNADIDMVLTSADDGRFLIVRVRSTDGATRSIDATFAIQRGILTKWLREHPYG